MSDQTEFVVRVIGPIVRLGDAVMVPASSTKSAELNAKIERLAAHPRLVVAGTQITKRFPALDDHQNDEYIQMVRFDLDGDRVEIPSSWLVPI